MSREEQRALITGATSGIGLAIARLLLQRGYYVILCGRNLQKIADLLMEYPEHSIGIAGDISNDVGRSQILNQVLDTWQNLHFIVHSAAIIKHETIGNISSSSAMEQLETNLIAPIQLTQALFPNLSPKSSILFVSSTLAQHPITTSAIYSASKAGLDAFMKTVALHGATKQIRANSLVLGMVDTPMIAQERPDEDIDHQYFSQLHLLNRLGQPAEVAETAVSILENAWMTGSEILLDGGLSLR